MDIREFRYIIEIANNRSMTKAASVLFITQPALSKMLKKIEEQFGVPLFFRDGNTMKLTEAGSYVVNHGQNILREYDAMEKHLQDLKTKKRARVLLGVPPVIAALDFPEIIMKFRKHFPDVAVEVHEYGARKLECMVLGGKLDIAISMHPVVSNGLSEIVIIQDQVVCAMNPDHPLASKESITLESLEPYPINTFPLDFAVYEELIKLFESKNLTPQIDVTSPTCDFLLKMSHLSNEICVLPAPCIRYYDHNNMILKPFDPSFLWGLCIVYRKNTFMTEKTRALIASIEQTVNPPL